MKITIFLENQHIKNQFFENIVNINNFDTYRMYR